ncbi:serine acetyltransferase [Chania multitudinisentens RB-25]|uniref:Serine acetyltransferase n=1 Tax=Chania multitudinisentens RB-25 TaxID=1441930 RepID=W0LIN2_9GAMM|nr:DapH/DapD/GlmU-related protein [Chania multitudinisentens]AHG21850.1 serine acetyltransferase [Chania multitudinisentens RB-25]
MIKNKEDYRRYLEADKRNLKVSSTLRSYFFNDVWIYQKRLRRAEYYNNCSKNVIMKVITRIMYLRKGRQLGFSIPLNTFSEGLSIAHYGTIAVNGKARIGSNCRIHACVNIGASATDSSCAPKIGNNCYIGPGAKLFGGIQLGDNVSVGANAVVNKSFPDDVILAGIPAKIIANRKLNRSI